MSGAKGRILGLVKMRPSKMAVMVQSIMPANANGDI
jgi:hypothetical protein